MWYELVFVFDIWAYFVNEPDFKEQDTMMKLRSTIGFKQWRDFLSIYNYKYYVVTSGFS